eukprot:351491-Chlamydomonas_euryale.AAC.2
MPLLCKQHQQWQSQVPLRPAVLQGGQQSPAATCPSLAAALALLVAANDGTLAKLTATCKPLKLLVTDLAVHNDASQYFVEILRIKAAMCVEGSDTVLAGPMPQQQESGS